MAENMVKLPQGSRAPINQECHSIFSAKKLSKDPRLEKIPRRPVPESAFQNAMEEATFLKHMGCRALKGNEFPFRNQ